MRIRYAGVPRMPGGFAQLPCGVKIKNRRAPANSGRSFRRGDLIALAPRGLAAPDQPRTVTTDKSDLENAADEHPARASALIRSVNPLGRHETITLLAHGYNLLGSPVFNLDSIHPAIPFPVNCTASLEGRAASPTAGIPEDDLEAALLAEQAAGITHHRYVMKQFLRGEAVQDAGRIHLARSANAIG